MRDLIDLSCYNYYLTKTFFYTANFSPFFKSTEKEIHGNLLLFYHPV